MSGMLLRRCRGRVPFLAFSPCQRLLIRPLAYSLFPRKTNHSPLPCARHASTTSANKEVSESSTASTTGDIYHGPLSATFKRLKIFSLSSLGLSITLAPFMFLVESSLPFPARIALASIAIGTSGLSTALVSWCGSPYVYTLKRLTTSDGREGLELITSSLIMKARVTRVYDPYFLIETRRPFAKWELAKELTLPPERSLDSIVPGKEETVAETLDHDGNILGRWIVQWDEKGQGKCHEAGSVIRHFNVHEELLCKSS